MQGNLSINGRSIKQTWVKPTFLSMEDEPLVNVTVEQALVYTGELSSVYGLYKAECRGRDGNTLCHLAKQSSLVVWSFQGVISSSAFWAKL